MIKTAAALLLLVSSAPGLAATPALSPVLSAYRTKQWERMSVHPTERVEFKLKGLSLLPGKGYLSPGLIPVNYVMTDGQDRWLLVPFTEVGHDGRAFDSEVADLSGQSYLAVNLVTGRAYPRVIDLKFSDARKFTVKSVKPHREIEFSKTPWLQPEGFSSQEESYRDIAATKRDMSRKAAAIEAVNRPVVSKIGAKICRVSDAGVLYIGYTEGRSPDSEKIQIRVTDAWVGGRSDLKPSGFAPSIIWDQPSQWKSCD